MPTPLPDKLRREIFAALVGAHDRRLGAAASRKAVAERFGVSEQHVREVGREGAYSDLPPAGAARAEGGEINEPRRHPWRDLLLIGLLAAGVAAVLMALNYLT